jgi:hypothetical protein
MCVAYKFEIRVLIFELIMKKDSHIGCPFVEPFNTISRISIERKSRVPQLPRRRDFRFAATRRPGVKL